MVSERTGRKAAVLNRPILVMRVVMADSLIDLE